MREVGNTTDQELETESKSKKNQAQMVQTSPAYVLSLRKVLHADHMDASNSLFLHEHSILVHIAFSEVF